MHDRAAARRASRGDGFTFVELAIAGAILSMIVLAVGVTITHETVHRRESQDSYESVLALRSFIAEVQAVANTPRDLYGTTGVTALYRTYNGQSFAAPGLPDGTIQVTCFADEATVPATLGGPQDMNFDGDAEDNLGGQAEGNDLQIVPMRFVLTRGAGGSARTYTAFRLVTKTVN